MCVRCGGSLAAARRNSKQLVWRRDATSRNDRLEGRQVVAKGECSQAGQTGGGKSGSRKGWRLRRERALLAGRLGTTLGLFAALVLSGRQTGMVRHWPCRRAPPLLPDATRARLRHRAATSVPGYVIPRGLRGLLRHPAAPPQSHLAAQQSTSPLTLFVLAVVSQGETNLACCVVDAPFCGRIAWYCKKVGELKLPLSVLHCNTMKTVLVYLLSTTLVAALGVSVRRQ